MRPRILVAALVIAGAAAGIAVYAWPASAKLPKPLALRNAPPRALPVVGTLRGDSDPHDFNLMKLVPRGSEPLGVWYAGRQILVKWVSRHAHVRHGLTRDSLPPFRWGLILWSPKTATRWQAVEVPVIGATGANGEMNIAFADVTSDGRADLLFEQHPGTNHGCGPREIVATSRKTGISTLVFSDYLCESGMGGDHGLLALFMAYYVHDDPMCCASYHEDLRLRWNGRRFVQDSVHITKSASYSG